MLLKEDGLIIDGEISKTTVKIIPDEKFFRLIGEIRLIEGDLVAEYMIQTKEMIMLMMMIVQREMNAMPEPIIHSDLVD